MQMTASDVKNRFGEVMEQARRETVTVTRSGRPQVAILDIAEYQRLRRIENEYWATLADRAKESGQVGTEAAMAQIVTAMSDGE